VFAPIDVSSFCAVEPDVRKGYERFEPDLVPSLPHTLFSEAELNVFENATRAYRERAASLSDTLRQKELERFVIELSWKSSRIEGNTYTLLDTERLIREGREADGHSKDEARMILNHKKAFEFVMTERELFSDMPALSAIEELHRILMADLGIRTGPRRQVVGITGTRYRPPDNSFQTREALESLIKTIGAATNPYTAAIYALGGLSYIQFFEDGNKRTARLTANAILLANHAAPLSYRSVDEVTYRESMLVFYETHSLMPLKKLFTAQYLFATEHYGVS
jgi:Fic family protein